MTSLRQTLVAVSGGMQLTAVSVYQGQVCVIRSRRPRVPIR
jgi:hypothetical protein